MRDDKIRNALMKMEPDAMLSAKIDAMVDAADLTPREPAMRRVKRPAKAMLIAAAIVVMMAMAVSAVGVFARLFYLPGAGLVDESGVLVIKEDDIGDLDVTAYRTAKEMELGGYVIESVTYTEYEGLRSYTVWSHMGDARMAELGRQADDSVITVADHVIPDLTLTLSDGTILTPESTRYSHSGSIVYNFAADVLDTNVVVSSETLGEAIAAVLCQVDGAGYSYMQYPTDRGITVIICPANEKYSEWKLDFIDNTIEEGLAKYVSKTGMRMEPGWLTFYDSNGEPVELSGYRSLSDTGISLALDDAPKEGFDIKIAELSRVMLHYDLVSGRDEILKLTFPMIADGERVDGDFTLLNDAGFEIGIKGYSREGDNITVYVETEENNPSGIGFAVPYAGDKGCAAAYARIYLQLGSLNGESIPHSVSTSGDWMPTGDGLYSRVFEIDKYKLDSLDAYENFTITLDHIQCVFDGNWTVTY